MPISLRYAVSVVFLFAAMLGNAKDQPFDPVPLFLSAPDILPAPVLSGQGYKVRDKVSNAEGQNTYTVESDFGVQTVTGTSELLARLQEIRATAALQELEDSEEFKGAAKAGVTGLVEGGKALIDEPGATAKSAAKGIGRWMRNVGSAATSEDPHQDGGWKTFIGYDAAKRAYAVDMGIDPYTDFAPFQQHLGDVASAATAGGALTSFALSIGTAGTLAGTVKSVSGMANMGKVLKDNPPSRLAEINLEKLLAMGIASYQAHALLKNYNYTPSEMTSICESLRSMGDIEGREIFVAFATSAPDEHVARFAHHYAAMLASYVNEVEKGDIVDIAGTAWLLSRSGALVGTFPLDYLTWTASLMEAMSGASKAMAAQGVSQKKLLISGQYSPAARAALTGRGWTLSENVEYRQSSDAAEEGTDKPGETAS